MYDINGVDYRDRETTSCNDQNPVFTYTKTEAPVCNTVKSNIELLKKNGEIIDKYYKKITNEIRRLTDEPIDDANITRCNLEILSILNEFVFERDKLYGTDLDQVTVPTAQDIESKSVDTKLVTDKNYIIHLIDKSHNDLYLTHLDYEAKEYETSANINNAFKYTYEEVNDIAWKLKEILKNNEVSYDIHVEMYKVLTTDEILERAYSTAESKRTDHQSVNMRSFTVDEQKKYDEAVSKLYKSTNTQLNKVDEADNKTKEFNRSESLTFAETDRENEWCRKHNDKYHKKDDDKKRKKNPFYQGVSPVSRFATVFQYCSISSWCECVCQDCYKEYEKEKDKLDRLAGDAKDFKKQKRLVDKLYKQAVFTVRDIDE